MYKRHFGKIQNVFYKTIKIHVSGTYNARFLKRFMGEKEKSIYGLTQRTRCNRSTPLGIKLTD
jgi:hypothetical protein